MIDKPALVSGEENLSISSEDTRIFDYCSPGQRASTVASLHVKAAKVVLLMSILQIM
jgi:hypothetical protein